MEHRADRWVISRVAGHVELPTGNQLSIRSKKAPLASLLTWMAYVDPALQSLRFLGASERAASEGELGAILARLFVLEMVEQISREGINRRYLRTRAASSAIRGTIDFAQLARQGGEPSRTPCIVWDRLPSTPLNRTLAATLQRIQRGRALRSACERELPGLLGAFAGIPPRPHQGLVSGAESLRRNEVHFEAALALARWILAATGLSEGMQSRGAYFLINLEQLFETTVSQSLRDSGVRAVSKKPLPIPWTSASGRAGSTTMEIDVLLEGLKDGPIVVDAKYKTHVASGNLQQVVAYCFSVGSREAVLAFPAGHLDALATFRFDGIGLERQREPSTISVRTAELRTDATSVSEWRENAATFARCIVSNRTRRQSEPPLTHSN